jgi:predicted RNA methylase
MVKEPRVGKQGIRLRKYEEAVLDLLCSNVSPSFVPLPSLPDHETISIINDNIRHKRNNKDEKWPFDVLPRSKVGESSNRAKRERKYDQLRSLIRCVLSMIPTHALQENDSLQRIRIVDFAGGSGHLALPLAFLLPNVDVVIVDIKAASLELAHMKAEEMCTVHVDHTNHDDLDQSRKQAKNKKKRPIPPGGLGSRDVDVTQHENVLRRCNSLKNLYTFHGSISRYIEIYNAFDIGLGLHACGEASDLILRACGKTKSNFIVSPCCVGKISSDNKNSYKYWSSGGDPEITYPQSTLFCSVITENDKFDALAKAADYSEMTDMRTNKNATRRAAKALLELDRLLYMKETFGYDEIVLTRMEPWESSCKNDILLGWMNGNERLRGPYDSQGGLSCIKPCQDCNTDLLLASNQLLDSDTIGICDVKVSTMWSEEDMKEIRNTIMIFLESDDSAFTFPTGMGIEKRKLIRFVSEQFGLRHWGIGKRNADKTVVIAKRVETPE